MKIVVGVQPDASGDEAVSCAEALARSMRADLVLTHVHPTRGATVTVARSTASGAPT